MNYGKKRRKIIEIKYNYIEEENVSSLEEEKQQTVELSESESVAADIFGSYEVENQKEGYIYEYASYYATSSKNAKRYY